MHFSDLFPWSRFWLVFDVFAVWTSGIRLTLHTPQSIHLVYIPSANRTKNAEHLISSWLWLLILSHVYWLHVCLWLQRHDSWVWCSIHSCWAHISCMPQRNGEANTISRFLFPFQMERKLILDLLGVESVDISFSHGLKYPMNSFRFENWKFISFMDQVVHTASRSHGKLKQFVGFFLIFMWRING